MLAALVVALRSLVLICGGQRTVALKNLAVARHNYVHRNSLTFAQLLARLHAMREASRTVAALRSALSRGNLLLELLALRHQLGVLDSVPDFAGQWQLLDVRAPRTDPDYLPPVRRVPYIRHSSHQTDDDPFGARPVDRPARLMGRNDFRNRPRPGRC